MDRGQPHFLGWARGEQARPDTAVTVTPPAVAVLGPSPAVNPGAQSRCPPMDSRGRETMGDVDSDSAVDSGLAVHDDVATFSEIAEDQVGYARKTVAANAIDAA